MDETLNDAPADPPYTPMTRMRAIVDTDRLDFAAVTWMSGVLVYVASTVIFALMLTSRNSPFQQSDGWTTVQQLGQTVDLAVLGALVIGLAIAAAFDSTLSRAAALLGAAGGAWAAVAGLLRIAYQAAAPDKNTVNGQWAFVYGTGFVIAALGALVLVASLRLFTTVRYDFDGDDEELDDFAEPDEL
jgi:hypothetical protein